MTAESVAAFCLAQSSLLNQGSHRKIYRQTFGAKGMRLTEQKRLCVTVSGAPDHGFYGLPERDHRDTLAN